MKRLIIGTLCLGALMVYSHPALSQVRLFGLTLIDSSTSVAQGTNAMAADNGVAGKLWFGQGESGLIISSAGDTIAVPFGTITAIATSEGSIFAAANFIPGDDYPARYWLLEFSQATGELLWADSIRGVNRVGNRLRWATNAPITSLIVEQGTIFFLYSAGGSLETGVYQGTRSDSVWATAIFCPGSRNGQLNFPSGLLRGAYNGASWWVTDRFRPGVYGYPDSVSGFTMETNFEDPAVGQKFNLLAGEIGNDVWLLSAEDYLSDPKIYHFRSSSFTAVRVSAPTDFQVSLYPNPTNASFTLDLSGALGGSATVVISNLQGQRVYCGSLTGQKTHFVTTWSSGPYFVQVQVGSCLLPPVKLLILK